MPITIHGNSYVTVAERVQEAHKALKLLDITTEVLSANPVVIRATVKTDRGTFTGISAANPSKSIEKMSPYEVAETSAVGRALGFAGFGSVDSIATADEMVKATQETKSTSPKMGIEDGDYEVLVEDIYLGKDKNGKAYEALKTDQGKMMVFERSGNLGIAKKGEQFGIKIYNGSVFNIEPLKDELEEALEGLEL